MPFYEYQCSRCHATFEVRATFHEKEIGLQPVCPNCQSAETRQVLTVGSFVRSGSSEGNPRSTACCGPNAEPGCCG